MMEGKRTIKIMAAIVGSIYICYIFQTSVFTHVELAGIVPNLLIALTSSFGYLKGRKYGLVVGFLSGLLMDIFMGEYFGLNALVMMYIGFLNGLIRIIFFGDDIKLPLFLIGLSDVLYGCSIFGVLKLMRERSDFVFYLKNVIFPEAIYTMIIGMGIFFAVDLLVDWMDKEDKRVRKSIV